MQLKFILSTKLPLPLLNNHHHCNQRCLSLPAVLTRRQLAGRRRTVAAAAVSVEGDSEWLKKLPEKKKPLYAHSLPCIEAWLRSLEFQRSREDRALWIAQRSDWHAQLSLDVTDLHIRYLKTGPGNLENDVERRFSYALSREDIENAILGGP